MIKSADVYVLSGLVVHEGPWSYRFLAKRLRVPHTVVQRALERARRAELYSAERREVHIPHFEEFALHALRFIAPAQLGGLSMGVAAAWATKPMEGAVPPSGDDLPPVWPVPSARSWGQAIDPLHPAAPQAALDWPELRELLALLDSLRAGNARVRYTAGDLLIEMLEKRRGRPNR